MSLFGTAIVIPTLNAAENWGSFVTFLVGDKAAARVLIIDSESDDQTAELAIASGFYVHSITRSDFNHGRTRQIAVDLLADVDIVIFMTQDAVLTNPTSIKTLLEPFEDPTVAATFGRQLPRSGAGPIETHARLFNYPAFSSIRTIANRERLGFKTIFISNSFAAYRRNNLMSVGGFPTNIIFGEDTVTAAKLILSGYKIAYVADAQVHHSHAYTWKQDFKRYFDIGVLHTRESWLLDNFGQTGGEGKRFVASELRYLFPNYWYLIPSALIRTVLKFIGYRLGRMEKYLSLTWKRRLSMHRDFWK